MKRKRFSLRAQFVLLIILGLSVLFVVIAVFVVRITANNLQTGLVNQSKSFVALATKPIGDTFATYQDSGTLKIIQQVEKFTDLDSNIKNVGVVGLDGKVLYQQHDGGNVQASSTQAGSFETVYETSGKRLNRVIAPYFEDSGAHRYSLVYEVSYDAINSSVRQLAEGIILLALIAFFVSIFVSYLLISRLFIRPLGLVSGGALAISKGNLDLKIEPKRNDEIGDLATSVNDMAEALKADIKKLKEVDAIKTEFMMIASHNLRTPLAIIQGYLDTLLIRRELPPDVHDMVAMIAASGNRLAVFAEDILTVSRLEIGENVTAQRAQVDLTQLISQVAKDFSALAKDKKLAFDVHLSAEPVLANISAPHIRAGIWNLLDNALKFTQQGTVSIGVEKQSGQAAITVSDTGAGIPPEEIPKLFTKFHRGTSALEYNYEGTGLGLYLTKLIIDQHGGTISVDSTVGRGTTFTIHLPLA